VEIITNTAIIMVPALPKIFCEAATATLSFSAKAIDPCPKHSDIHN
jgi:hypothetical protein